MRFGKREVAGALAALALAVLGSSVGCRAPHLGKDTGHAYHQAFDQQATPEEEGPALSADDAANVMKTHHGSKGKKSETGDGGASSPATPLSWGSLSWGGAWPGATGNISLEGK
jgi:hypothetical protein